MIENLNTLQIKNYKRIAIIGMPGAGKSTVARFLGGLLGLPVEHVDLHYWKAGWQKHTAEEWAAIHVQLISQPQWIIEGCALKSSFLERVSAADLVVYLRFSRIRCLWHVIKRAVLSRFYQIPDQPVDCPHYLPWRLIKYLWHFDSLLTQILLPQAVRLYPNVPIVVIESYKELQKFCEQLR